MQFDRVSPSNFDVAMARLRQAATLCAFVLAAAPAFADETRIRNLLQLNQGSVVELDRVAGESLDVMVNGTLIAHGEVVVVNDKFGIRLTDVISQTERIKKLR